MSNRPISDKGPRVWRYKRLRNKPSVIYFIQPADQPFIKVGRTRDLWPRLCGLQTGNPHQLELLFVIEGDEERENEIHLALSRHSVRGEWFRMNDDVRRALDHLRPLAFDYDEHMGALLEEQVMSDREAMLNRTRPDTTPVPATEMM